MSENMFDTNPVEGATEGADTDPVEGTTAEADPTVDGDDRGTANKEAAKYRTRLREVEGERDALTDRLATLQRREAERLAADQLADPADLWRDGVELAALLDDDGNLDASKVAEAAGATVAQHRHWAAQPTPRRHPDSRRGLASGATGRDQHRPAPSWQKVLKSRLGDD